MNSPHSAQQFENYYFMIPIYFAISTLHPKGIEPLSQEPESYVISITLRVLTVYYYSIL